MVYHVLKDGSKPTDITGRVVRMSDAAPIYNLLESINRKSYARQTTVIHNPKRGKEVC